MHAGMVLMNGSSHEKDSKRAIQNAYSLVSKYNEEENHSDFFDTSTDKGNLWHLIEFLPLYRNVNVNA